MNDILIFGGGFLTGTAFGSLIGTLIGYNLCQRDKKELAELHKTEEVKT